MSITLSRRTQAASKVLMSAWDSRRNNFDFLRLALAILVIYSHAFPLGLGSEALEPVKRLSHGQITGGGFAVDAFFIMSGFLIAASAERSSSIRSFLAKRIRRIYPAFLVSAVLSAAVLVPLAKAHSAAATLPGAAANFLFQSLRLTEFSYIGAFAGNPYPGVINGSVWSIPYEFFCYLGVAGLTAAGLLRRRGTVLALFCAAWAVSLLSLLRHWNFGGKLLGQALGSPQFWARLLPFYLAGVVFYLYRDRLPLRGAFAAASALALAASCWLPSAGLTATLPVAGTYLIFWLAFTPSVRLHHFGRFGDFSYGTYLYAFPVEQLLMQRFGHPVRPLLLFVYALPVTLLLAAASWYAIERPFLQPARRKVLPVQAVPSEAH